MPPRIPTDRPVYRLTEPFFDPHENYHPTDTIIIFEGIPNQGMVPLNDKARAAYDAYIDALDVGLKAVCEAEKRAFSPHARIYDEPDIEIADVSRGSTAPEKPGVHLGRRGRQGHGAEALV